MTTPPALAAAVGRRIRSLRDQHGITADSLAVHARKVGLRWQRSTVASIETGKRGVTGEELLLLPLVLSMALPVAVGLPDLLDEEVALTDELTMTPAGFRQLLTPGGGIWGGYKLRSAPPVVSAVQRLASVEIWRRIEELWPEVHGTARVDLSRLRAVEHAAGREAEQNAARALGCHPLDVSAVAHRLWGRGMTEERDQRVASGMDPGESPATGRVRRGHVSRQLLEELSRALPTPNT